MPPSDPNPGGEPTPIQQPSRPAPNVQEIDWKQRALDAEAALAVAQQEVRTLTEACATHERNIESITRAKAEADEAASRERTIAEALAPHRPIDGDLCATLIERELERESIDNASSAFDLASRLGPIVAKLATDRPYLFRTPTRSAPGAAMAREPGAPARTPVEDALDEARTDGSRTTLLKYLRVRRGA